MKKQILFIDIGEESSKHFTLFLEKQGYEINSLSVESYLESDCFTTGCNTVVILHTDSLKKPFYDCINKINAKYPRTFPIILSDHAVDVYPSELKSLSIFGIIPVSEMGKELPLAIENLAIINDRVTNSLNNMQLDAVMSGFQQGASRLLHDLNSPITALSNTVEMMDFSEIASERHIKLLNGSIERLQEMTQNWHSYLFGNPSPETAVNILLPLCDAISLIHFANPKVNLATVPKSLHPDNSSPCHEILIRGNFFGLLQIFHHVIINAYEAIEDSAFPVVTIQLEEDDNNINIFFEDNGPGVKEEIKDNLWKDFIRGKEEPHWGMGLGIVRYLLMFHRGSISLDNGELGGARFKLSFRKT